MPKDYALMEERETDNRTNLFSLSNCYYRYTELKKDSPTKIFFYYTKTDQDAPGVDIYLSLKP